MAAFRWCLLTVLAFSTARAQKSYAQPVIVPEQVASLVRPILDLLQQSIADCGKPGTREREGCVTGSGRERQERRWWKIGEEIASLSSQRTPAADEALVVLMCYYTGESGDNEDAVVNRGRRELPYLLKYWKTDPVIPRGNYSDSMRLTRDAKDESFEATVSAIHNGETRE